MAKERDRKRPRATERESSRQVRSMRLDAPCARRRAGRGDGSTRAQEDARERRSSEPPSRPATGGIRLANRSRMIERASTTRTRLADHIQQLAAFAPTAFPVLSLYLDLVPYQHDHDRDAAFVRAALADRLSSLHPHAPERESLERDTTRIDAWLREHLPPSASGLAIFACSGDGFFDAVQLDDAARASGAVRRAGAPSLSARPARGRVSALRRGDARCASRAHLCVRPRYNAARRRDRRTGYRRLVAGAVPPAR